MSWKVKNISVRLAVEIRHIYIISFCTYLSVIHLFFPTLLACFIQDIKFTCLSLYTLWNPHLGSIQKLQKLQYKSYTVILINIPQNNNQRHLVLSSNWFLHNNLNITSISIQASKLYKRFHKKQHHSNSPNF